MNESSISLSTIETTYTPDSSGPQPDKIYIDLRQAERDLQYLQELTERVWRRRQALQQQYDESQNPHAKRRNQGPVLFIMGDRWYLRLLRQLKLL